MPRAVGRNSRTTANTLCRCPSEIAYFGIQITMPKLLITLALIVVCAQAQSAAPATASGSADNANAQPRAIDDSSPAGEHVGKVGLVRGVLRRIDPIHDQLLIRAFGGGDIRIAFDPRTRIIAENAPVRLTSLGPGSVVSVDTVIESGKLFARSVRTGPSNAAELNGQVVRYDAAQSRLILSDPISPEGISVRIGPSTTVINQGQPASLQALSAGALVRVWFSASQNTANKIEVFAERGNSFTFQGRIVAVDLRSGIVSLVNDSDQSVRELAIGSLGASSVSLLREGANVSMQAVFDGNRYSVRSVAVVATHQ